MKKGFIYLITLLFACNKQTELVIHKFERPENSQSISLSEMNSSYNYLIFIGKGDLLYNIEDEENNDVPYEYFYQPLEGVNKWFTEKNLMDVPFKILVDTSNIVLISFFPDAPEDLDGDKIPDWISNNKKKVEAYPVYIWNPTNKTTSIPVTGVTTDIIQEAKDEKGNWKPIEFHVPSLCGNGTWEYILKPSYYAISSIYKYTGDFKTEIRVKFRRGRNVYYSNSFEGSINKGQFSENEYFNKPDNFLQEENSSR